MKTALLIPDCHWPYADGEAYKMMLAVGQDLQPDYVYVLGDFADFYDVNAHGKDPGIQTTLRAEIRCVRKQIQRLEQLFPQAELHFVVGNHEHRLARFIANKAPELYGVIGLEDLLGLYRWTVHPYGPAQLAQVGDSKLFVRHEPYANGVHVAHGSVVKAGCSVAFGHTHRIQEAQVVMANGDNHRGISLGWLGDESHPAFGYVKAHHQWAKGFGVAELFEDGTFLHHMIHIIKRKDGGYRCSYDGTVYES